MWLVVLIDMSVQSNSDWDVRTNIVSTWWKYTTIVIIRAKFDINTNSVSMWWKDMTIATIEHSIDIMCDFVKVLRSKSLIIVYCFYQSQEVYEPKYIGGSDVLFGASYCFNRIYMVVLHSIIVVC